jgi:hypothetical protein
VYTADNNDIYVFDRGYLDFSLLESLHKNNKYFICRIRKNTKQLDETRKDYIIKNNYFDCLRIIVYIINNKYYYLCTNLKENIDSDTIKNIYYKRWSVEEYFKMLKKATNINNINETKINNIKKNFFCYSIMNKLLYLINNHYNNLIDNNNNNKTVKKLNLSNLVKCLYDNTFYVKFFMGTFTMNELETLFKTIIVYTYSKINRSFIRICKRSVFLSYFKSYSINNKRSCK